MKRTFPRIALLLALIMLAGTLALGESAPLEMELERTRERMQRIRAASETCENEELRQAMLNAVRAHEQRIALLEKRLQEG